MPVCFSHNTQKEEEKIYRNHLSLQLVTYFHRNYLRIHFRLRIFHMVFAFKMNAWSRTISNQ